MSETETSTEGIRAPALRYEHPYPARSHRRKSAGRIGSQAREALDAAPHERRRETDWAVNRPERCVFLLYFSCLLPSFSYLLCSFMQVYIALQNILIERIANFVSFFKTLASIFKRMSDVPDLDYNISQDFTAAYKVSSSFKRLRRIF